MRKIIITLLVSAIFIIALSSISTISVYGSYISESTQQKYLRNLGKYEMINGHHFYISFNYSDTLSFIAKIRSNCTDPFHKWYIDDVGTIPPNSKLSKALDSLASKWIERANPKL